MMRLVAGACLLLALAEGTGRAETCDEKDILSPGGGITLFRVRPSAIEPTVTPFHPDCQHMSYAPAANTDNHKLLVFFGGHGTKPSAYQRFMIHAASLGYHVIGLSHWNLVNIPNLCTLFTPCFGAVRDEIFDDTPAAQYDLAQLLSYFFSFNSTEHAKLASNEFHSQDAVRHRLTTFLKFLQAHAAAGSGWGAFLQDPSCAEKTCAIKWSTVTLAGHSQGGGMAAFIATREDVDRVLMFSAPADAIWSFVTANPDQPRQIITADWATVRSHPLKFFGLVNLLDTADSYDAVDGDANSAFSVPPRVDRAKAVWQALGLGVSYSSIDDAQPPYDQSRLLTTSLDCEGHTPPNAGAAHAMTAADCAGGEPAFLVRAWDYMLTAP